MTINYILRDFETKILIEKAKICIESALSEFGLYESLGIRDYLKSAYDNMLKALKELEE